MSNLNIEDPAGNTTSSLGPALVPSGNIQFPSQPSQRLSSASSYADLHYLFAAQDATMIAPKLNRNRRKSTQGPDHTKHRRTRSGCYTCRSRRVKCDEAHPICDRCRKGGRECVYPEPLTSSKASGSLTSKSAQSTAHASPAASSSDEGEDESPSHLGAIPDDEEMLEGMFRPPGPSRSSTQRSSISQASTDHKSATRTPSETPSLMQDKSCASPTPSTEGSVGYSVYQGMGRQGKSSISSASGSNLRSDWSHLPPDLQFYLTYFYENLTHCHYSLKLDSGNFLRTRFLDAALRNDALLHAVVGFSAFQRTLHNPAGRIQDFLQYYNKSVSLLLNSLRKGHKRDIGTLLAVLQLATIEEFLGDWINLLGHQKAAYEILTELYTPQTVMEEPMTRVILGWYIRFDVFAGLMGGFETVLSREWFSYSQHFFAQQVLMDPQELDWKIEHALAQQRLIAMDMSLLFARQGKGEISQETFIRENELVAKRIEEWKVKMDPALQDPRYLVMDFSGARPLDPDDIVNPYQQGTLFQGRLWVMNIANIDWLSIDLMHKYQTALTLKTPPSKDLAMKAYAICQLFEAMEFYPGSPRGTLLASQASIGIACLFLPRDERHAMWGRRKLASIECNGYIYPYTFRTKMAALFRDQSCMQWWLRNDECYPPIIRSIRKFVEERSASARNIPAQEDLRDMKAIFASLNLNNEDSNMPSNLEKRKASIVDASLAAHQEVYETEGNIHGITTSPQGDAYGLGFDHGRGFWGDQQGGGAFGIQKQ